MWIDLFAQGLIIALYGIFAFALVSLINYWLKPKLIFAWIFPLLVFVTGLVLLIIGLVDDPRLLDYAMLDAGAFLGALIATLAYLAKKRQ